MMINFEDYNYLPSALIAQTPATPRDSSRLFVYNTQTDAIIFDKFFNLDKYLPNNSFLVLNKTKVLPARVEFKKSTGGKVMALLLINELGVRGYGLGGNIIRAMVDRKVNVGEKLYLDNDHFFEAIDQKEKIFYLKFSFSRDWLLKKLLEIGKTPVPLYLRKIPLSEKELRIKYQTVFADKMRGVEARTPDGWRKGLGSVAAPTVSLHFTNRVFNRLEEKGIKKFFVALHVGLGTFAPISEVNLREKKLHEEYFEIDKDTLQCFKTLKSKGKKLVAVGTTVVRSLESITRSKILDLKSKIFGRTDLFIFPPYEFKMVDCLVTNFHLPNSSLMMLVEAFLQSKKSKRRLVDLYQIAIKEKFRFYSFGDAMVII